jgi:hypothetical protein
MKITAYGREYPCARYEKGPDGLLLYDERDSLIASFEGISDWDGYEADGVPLAESPTSADAE